MGTCPTEILRLRPAGSAKRCICEPGSYDGDERQLGPIAVIRAACRSLPHSAGCGVDRQSETGSTYSVCCRAAAHNLVKSSRSPYERFASEHLCPREGSNHDDRQSPSLSRSPRLRFAWGCNVPRAERGVGGGGAPGGGAAWGGGLRCRPPMKKGRPVRACLLDALGTRSGRVPLKSRVDGVGAARSVIAQRHVLEATSSS